MPLAWVIKKGTLTKRSPSSRAGLEPAPLGKKHTQPNYLSFWSWLKKEKRERTASWRLHNELLANQAILAFHSLDRVGYSICAQGAASPSLSLLPRQDYRLVILASPPTMYWQFGVVGYNNHSECRVAPDHYIEKLAIRHHLQVLMCRLRHRIFSLVATLHYSQLTAEFSLFHSAVP